MKQAFKYLGFFILLPIYHLSRLVPRNSKIWIFGSCDGNHIADNPYYLYKHCSSINDGIKKIYITKNKDLAKKNSTILHNRSLPAIYYSLRAKYFFLSHSIHDTNAHLTGGSTIIQLWHGIPLKKIGDDTGPQKPSKKDLLIKGTKKFANFLFSPFRYNRCDYLLNPSSITREIFFRAFSSSSPKIIDAPQPRLDALSYNNKINKNGLRICWLPTHRKSYGAFKYKTSKLLEDRNFDKFESYLIKNNHKLFIKPHPIDKESLEPLVQGLISVELYEEIDPYPLLESCDILITDYSSIYFDFLKTGRPIIFTPFDLQKYKEDVSGLYFDYDQITPGAKCNNWIDVINHIEDLLSNKDSFKYQREELAKRLNIQQQRKSSCEFFYNEFVKREKIL